MNTSDIIWRLAQLASLPYQERYVICGSANEYIVDVDLLENVDSLKYLIRKPENQCVVSVEQMAALEDLFRFIEINSHEALASDSRDRSALMIRESSVWRNLRAKAAAALNLFGLSVDNMAVEEIDQLSE